MGALSGGLRFTGFRFRKWCRHNTCSTNGGRTETMPSNGCSSRDANNATSFHRCKHHSLRASTSSHTHIHRSSSSSSATAKSENTVPSSYYRKHATPCKPPELGSTRTSCTNCWKTRHSSARQSNKCLIQPSKRGNQL